MWSNVKTYTGMLVFIGLKFVLSAHVKSDGRKSYSAYICFRSMYL